MIEAEIDFHFSRLFYNFTQTNRNLSVRFMPGTLCGLRCIYKAALVLFPAVRREPSILTTLTAVLAEVLPGVLFVLGVQREFEDLLAVLIFSPEDLPYGQSDIRRIELSIKNLQL